MAKGRKTGGADWRKGQSGNPKGGKKLPEEIKEIRKFTVEQIIGTFSKYLGMTQEEMLGVDKRKLSLLEVWLLKAAEIGIKTGNYFILDKILDRVIGKTFMGIRIETDDKAAEAGQRLEEILNILKKPRKTQSIEDLMEQSSKRQSPEQSSPEQSSEGQ
jgi:hypothetical protein